MTHIGGSISEAIDWTQDRLVTTRPVAERTLFSLMADRAVSETEHGFVLTEEEEEIDKHFQKVKNNMSKNWKQFKFHTKRKNSKQRQRTHLDNSSAAEGMMASESEDDDAMA